MQKARLGVRVVELLFEPGAIGRGERDGERVEEEEPRRAPTHRVRERRLAVHAGVKIAQKRWHSAVDELVVPDAGEDATIAEELALDAEERVPLLGSSARQDHVAGVDREIGRVFAHLRDDGRVRDVIAAVVAVDVERVPRVAVSRRRERALVASGARGGDRIAVRRAGREPRDRRGVKAFGADDRRRVLEVLRDERLLGDRDHAALGRRRFPADDDAGRREALQVRALGKTSRGCC
jgi:hypothetical protein